MDKRSKVELFRKLLNLLALICASAAIALYFVSIGYSLSLAQVELFDWLGKIIVSIFFFSLLASMIFGFQRESALYIRAIYLICGLFTVPYWFNYYSGQQVFFGFMGLELPSILMRTGITVFLIMEISRQTVKLHLLNLGPGKVLMLVLGVLILGGTLMLMLPNSSTKGIALVDAFFLAVSAVCITGLTPVDISEELTYSGQVILMVLFQLGGIGIMTITSFFAFFFKKGSSYQHQLYLRNFIQSDQLNNLFSLLFKIIVITLQVELLGALLIYFSVQHQPEILGGRAFFFAIFHSVSAFCNAGFSLFGESLHDFEVRHNYLLQWSFLLIFFLGSMGFFLIDNFAQYLRNFAKKYYRLWVKGTRTRTVHMTLTFNSKLILFSSLALLLFGFLGLLILEWDGQLAQHNWMGKITGALFTSATPRSAGFNVLDTAGLSIGAIWIIILLMWIGGGPGSTAGGIKVTTFSVAMMTIFNTIKGSNHVDFKHREISQTSIQKAFAVIVLSILGIGITTFVLLLTEPGADFIAILFETVSAYCTVGLSMGLTPELSNAGKIVICISMYVGRIGLIAILTSFIKQVYSQDSHYPKEEIFIN